MYSKEKTTADARKETFTGICPYYGKKAKVMASYSVREISKWDLQPTYIFAGYRCDLLPRGAGVLT